MSHPKAAANVARHAYNKLRPRTPQEFLCLVGAPSNTFNGWMTDFFYIEANGAEPWAFTAGMPAPRSQADIKYYVGFTPQTYSGSLAGVTMIREKGWSQQACERARQDGRDVSRFFANRAATHDVYWGNFAVSASRLYTLTGFPDPLKKPDPRPGDIITFMVYAPGYDQRWKIDFRASPYNRPVHYKKYIRPDDPAAQSLRDPYAYTGPKVRVPVPVDYTPAEQRQRAEAEARHKREIEEDRNRPLDEDDVNFYILMSTTNGIEDHYMRRARYNRANSEYRGWLLEEAVDGASAKYPACLVKILFFSKPDEFLKYVKSGSFSGTEGKDFDFTPGRPVQKDAYNRPMKWPFPWHSYWNDTPSVKRSKIKIRRFDYFGHSSEALMMLEYGWTNSKGEEPSASVWLEFPQLNDAFQPGVLASDAHASLWGCYLGGLRDTEKNTVTAGIGAKLASRFRGGVCAAEEFTEYAEILVADDAMPFPATWDTTGKMTRRDFKFYPFSNAASKSP